MLDLYAAERTHRSEWTHEVLRFVEDFYDELRRTRSHVARSADLTAFEDPAEQPADLATLLELLSRAASDAVETAGPRYFGYFPSGGLYASALGEFLGQVLNRYTGVNAMAPALCAMERDLIAFFGRQFQMPETAGGLFTSGASLATLTALHCAREDRLGTGDRAAVIYVTEHTHLSTAKAAQILGFGPDQLRTVPTTAGLTMNVDALTEAIALDRQAGLTPFLVVGTAGTTSTGSIDPLARIAQVCADLDLWFHVDGAYGAGFWFTERGRVLLEGMQAADSLVWDPHKSLFLPYGTGLLLVRDQSLLRAANAIDGPYLQDLDLAVGPPDAASLGPELTREFRGLRVWLPLRLHGLRAVRSALAERLDWASWLRDSLSRERSLQVLPSDLSVVAFRHEGGKSATQAVLQRLHEQERFFLSSTAVEGEQVGRLCVLSHRTTLGDVHDLYEALVVAAADIN